MTFYMNLYYAVWDSGTNTSLFNGQNQHVTSDVLLLIPFLVAVNSQLLALQCFNCNLKEIFLE